MDDPALVKPQEVRERIVDGTSVPPQSGDREAIAEKNAGTSHMTRKKSKTCTDQFAFAL